MLTFECIPGRGNLKKRLTSEISEGKIKNAYIFEGPEGCGKKDMATAFALMILCTGKDEKPCGSCPHCKNIRAGGNGELYSLETETASISVDSIRKLQENISLKPVASARKVYLIADADRMTPQAQNCILKTLEEPPPYAHILMTAQDSGKLLDTVRSRSVILQTGINSVEEVERYLQKHTDADAGGVAVAARCSSGSYKKAL
jgi:DNA polymerase-3 subunit delta'